MNSPFPGMDPYLERHWLDVHSKLVTYSADELNTRLPPDLIARIEERTSIEVDPSGNGTESSHRQLAPDARVFEAVGEDQGGTAGGGVALAPYRLVLLDEPATERFVEIIDTRGGERLVTVIEFVSPSNKIGQGLADFAKKREDLLAGGVNFVEIDLTRAGDWERLLRPHACPPNVASMWRAVIRVPHDRLAAYLQPLALRKPLPALKIPLRPADEPSDLPLQMLIENVYRNGRYGRTLNYAKPCDPVLAGDDEAWADQLLKAAGRRA